MAIRLIALDPETGGGNCPAIWVDDEEQEFLIQGYVPDEATTARTQQDSPLPPTEAVIRLPYRMRDALRKALDAADQQDALGDADDAPGA